jgi:hypothetical protein
VSADQIFGCVAIVAMLSIVVDRLARDRTPHHRQLRMALIWIAIVAVVVAIGFATRGIG